MSEPTKTSWRIAGEEFGSCNCAWGCPCQFNALPTHGRCEAFLGCLVSDGYFGNTRLDGIRFARLYWWPGAIHEGNGVRRTIVDEQATKEQREALIALDSGQHGGPYWEIFAAVCPNLMEAASEACRLELVTYQGFRQHVKRNPKYQRRLKEAEGRVDAGGKFTFELKNTYAQLNAFDWSN